MVAPGSPSPPLITWPASPKSPAPSSPSISPTRSLARSPTLPGASGSYKAAPSSDAAAYEATTTTGSTPFFNAAACEMHQIVAEEATAAAGFSDSDEAVRWRDIDEDGRRAAEAVGSRETAGTAPACRCEMQRQRSRCCGDEEAGPSDGAGSESYDKSGEDEACAKAAILLTNVALGRQSADNVSVIVVNLRRRQRPNGLAVLG